MEEGEESEEFEVVASSASVSEVSIAPDRPSVALSCCVNK